MHAIDTTKLAKIKTVLNQSFVDPLQGSLDVLIWEILWSESCARENLTF